MKSPETRGGLGLHHKLFLASAASIVVCVASVASVLVYHHTRTLSAEIARSSMQLRDSMIERGQQLVESTASIMENAIAGFDFNFVAETAASLQENNDELAWAMVANKDGKIVVHTYGELVGSTFKNIGWNGMPRFFDDDVESGIVMIGRSLTVGGNYWGKLVLAFDVKPIDRTAAASVGRGRKILARTITMAFVLALLVAGLGLTASTVLSRRLLRPVANLSRDAAAIAAGDLDTAVPTLKSRDEIGILALQFERMRRSLKSHISELVQARRKAEAATTEEQRLRAEIESHSRLLESKVRERTAELETTNERLKEYDRLKTEFLSNVSHELRSPIAAISSAARIINRYADHKPDSARRFSGVIMEETNRLSRLINDLLDLAKIESGKVEWKLERIASPLDIFTHVYSTFKPLFTEQGIDFSLKSADNLPAIVGDRDRLIQVITNLCSNAIKFTPAGGKVEIAVSAETRNGHPVIRVVVTDSGSGIPEDQLEHVFGRFHQVSTDNKPKGTGLGLAICREVIEHHWGKIWAEPCGRGGTRMVIVLPACGTGAPATAAGEDRPALG
ncbi:MAG: ATP-binding protein [Candidatus Binatia bacterium]